LSPFRHVAVLTFAVLVCRRFDHTPPLILLLDSSCCVDVETALTYRSTTTVVYSNPFSSSVFRQVPRWMTDLGAIIDSRTDSDTFNELRLTCSWMRLGTHAAQIRIAWRRPLSVGFVLPIHKKHSKRRCVCRLTRSLASANDVLMRLYSTLRLLSNDAERETLGKSWSRSDL